MISIFSIPKPFEGQIDIIQKNAIKSWLKLLPKCEIILFGDDKGVKEVSKEFNILNISNIKKNEFGTPILSSAFGTAKKIAKNNILAYINSDIILTSDFVKSVEMINFKKFLASGRRWDMEINNLINFNDHNWENKILESVKNGGLLHGHSGIDYFVFPKDLPCDLPNFAVGRPGWDNWFIYYIKSLNIPIIDATDAITVIHQNHKSIYKNKTKENKKNIDLAGGLVNMCTLREADFELTKNGLIKPNFLRFVLGKLILFYPWRFLLSVKRKINFDKI